MKFTITVMADQEFSPEELDAARKIMWEITEALGLAVDAPTETVNSIDVEVEQ